MPQETCFVCDFTPVDAGVSPSAPQNSNNLPVGWGMAVVTFNNGGNIVTTTSYACPRHMAIMQAAIFAMIGT